MKPKPVKDIQDHQENKQEIPCSLNSWMRIIIHLMIIDNHNSAREIV